MINSGSGPSRADRFREEFTRMIARPEEDLDLGQTALLVAGEEYPELNVAEYLERLDDFADAVRQRAPEWLPPEELAKIVGRYLFEEQGFQGNSGDYYNPDNSYFNRVLDTHTGDTHYAVAAVPGGCATSRTALPGSGYAGPLPCRVGGRGNLL